MCYCDIKKGFITNVSQAVGVNDLSGPPGAHQSQFVPVSCAEETTAQTGRTGRTGAALLFNIQDNNAAEAFSLDHWRFMNSRAWKQNQEAGDNRVIQSEMESR